MLSIQSITLCPCCCTRRSQPRRANPVSVRVLDVSEVSWSSRLSPDLVERVAWRFEQVYQSNNPTEADIVDAMIEWIVTTEANDEANPTVVYSNLFSGDWYFSKSIPLPLFRFPDSSGVTLRYKMVLRQWYKNNEFPPLPNLGPRVDILGHWAPDSAYSSSIRCRCYDLTDGPFGPWHPGDPGEAIISITANYQDVNESVYPIVPLPHEWPKMNKKHIIGPFFSKILSSIVLHPDGTAHGRTTIENDHNPLGWGPASESARWTSGTRPCRSSRLNRPASPAPP